MKVTSFSVSNSFCITLECIYSGLIERSIQVIKGKISNKCKSDIVESYSVSKEASQSTALSQT
jgi:hypothetical protein